MQEGALHILTLRLINGVYSSLLNESNREEFAQRLLAVATPDVQEAVFRLQQHDEPEISHEAETLYWILNRIISKFACDCLRSRFP